MQTEWWTVIVADNRDYHLVSEYRSVSYLGAANQAVKRYQANEKRMVTVVAVIPGKHEHLIRLGQDMENIAYPWRKRS